MLKALFVAAAIPVLAVLAEPVPTTPAPGAIYNEGADCPIAWTADSTGTWTTMNIELMTGSNADMVHLTTVATVDATKATTFTYKCPTVSPNSAIYFYQFSSPADAANLTWTGRFAIADTSGKTVPPAETTDGIAWGSGALADTSSASAQPTYLSQATAAPASATSGAASSSSAPAPSTTPTAVPPTSAVPPTAAPPASASGSASLTSVRSVAPTGSASLGSANNSGGASGTAGSLTPSSTTSGGAALGRGLKTRGMQALAGLAGTALVFVTVF
ncbi:hypothetical protein DFH11DRAFT_1690629 [Phellopilus nigrolimitatus]|nr:hypothetical protein DFH11DRAFT_1690629 [Phellopilus nigrolimitatus]